MPDANNVAAQFQLRAIELHEVIINKPAPGTTPPARFNFDLTIESNVDAPQKLVINSIKVNIKGDNLEVVLGSITCATIFSVANFEEVINMKSETLAEINESFGEALNSISISTTRGVMFAELKGTFLHNAFLPIIDVKGMQKQVPKQTATT